MKKSSEKTTDKKSKTTTGAKASSKAAKPEAAKAKTAKSATKPKADPKPKKASSAPKAEAKPKGKAATKPEAAVATVEPKPTAEAYVGANDPATYTEPVYEMDEGFAPPASAVAPEDLAFAEGEGARREAEAISDFENLPDPATGLQSGFPAEDQPDEVPAAIVNYAEAVAEVEGGAARLQDYHFSLAEVEAFEGLTDDERDLLARLPATEPIPPAILEKLADQRDDVLDDAFIAKGVQISLAAAAFEKTTDFLLNQSDALTEAEESKDALNALRELTPEEQSQLEFFESQIADGLKAYVKIGGALWAIWFLRLHEGAFSSWKEYVETKWNMSSSGAFDLMKAFKTWRQASSDGLTFREAVSPDRWLVGASAPEASDASDDGDDGKIHEGEAVFEDDKPEAAPKSSSAPDSAPKPKADPKPKAEDKPAAPSSDTDAPSQRSIEELSRVSALLDKADMSDDDFREWETVAVREFYQMIRDFAPDGKFTQKVVKEAVDAFLEFAKAKAFEIDGEHYKAGAAGDFRITRGLFEKLIGEKTAIREMLDERRKSLSKPQARDNSEFSFVPKEGDDSAPTIFMRCSCGAEGCDLPFRAAYASFQMLCGHFFGRPQGQIGYVFNPKLTKDNPISEDEKAEYLAKLKADAPPEADPA